MFLSWLAASKLEVPAIAGAFYGVQPVVVAVVMMAVVKIAKKSLRHPAMYLFPLAAFLAVRLLGISFPWVVLGAAAGGIILHRIWPQTSCLGTWEPESKTCVADEESGGQHSRGGRFGLCLEDVDRLRGPLGGPLLNPPGLAGLGRRAGAGGGLFHQGRLCDLWRSLCGIELYRRIFSGAMAG
jgi:hypothetical protein